MTAYDEKTVRNYKKVYLKRGLDVLCSDNYQSGLSLLSKSEQSKLKQELSRTIYPSTQSVIDHVEARFGVRYSQSGMSRLLGRLGFSYKKPDPVPGKACAESQENFLDELEELKNSKKAKNPLLYLDGVHPQHNSHPTYGWLPRGEKTELKTNTGRKRVTLNGALDSESLGIITQEDETLNAASVIKFLKKIESCYPNADVIYCVLDNARYYRNKDVTEFLEDSKIEFLFLPPYAPNLNLIERVWKFLKKKILANRYYESYLEFKKACLDFFKKRSWKKFRAELETLLAPNFQITGRLNSGKTFCTLL